MMNCKRYGVVILASVALLAVIKSAQAEDQASPDSKVLKVCADPHYMPFSSQDGKGYENRIAEIIANELGRSVQYTWFPQRLGFIRNTLRKESPNGQGYLCDVVMGVTQGYELAATTQPYMQSTYALVTVAGGKLERIRQPSDLLAITPNPQMDSPIRIGVTETGPGAMWLAKHNLYQYMTSYPAQSGDPNEFPSEAMLKDLWQGKLDAAIVWGPTAAYFERLSPQERRMTIHTFSEEPGVRFSYPISAAVRFGEKDWKAQIDQALSKRKNDIQNILHEYGIPLVNEPAGNTP